MLNTPPPGTFGPTLIRWGGGLKRYGFPIKKVLGTFSKISSRIFFFQGECLKRYGAKISNLALIRGVFISTDFDPKMLPDALYEQF